MRLPLKPPTIHSTNEKPNRRGWKKDDSPGVGEAPVPRARTLSKGKRKSGHILGVAKSRSKSQYLEAHTDNPDSSVDQESVLVEDFIHYFDEYSDRELARMFTVSPRRIYAIKRQKHVSFAIADKWLTAIGLGHLLDGKIKVKQLPAALQTKQDQWDGTDSPADAHA